MRLLLRIRDTSIPHDLKDALIYGALSCRLIDQQRLRDLLPDARHRIEIRHRILRNKADVGATQTLKLMVGIGG